MLMKILLIQYLKGFRSVRFTCKQVKQHAMYRWFLGISPTEKIPDHSTISKFLSQRLQGAAFWRSFFNIVFFSFTMKDLLRMKHGWQMKRN